MDHFSSNKIQPLEGMEIVIDIFVDGLSPHKSVKRHLWPIAGCIINEKVPFVIALWCGSSKEPESVDEFLRDFISEASDLLENGFQYRQKSVHFKIRNYIADAPARAWMRKVRPHNSYNSCERCIIHGEWKFRRLTFNPHVESTLRTDESLINQSHKAYHLGVSTLLKLDTKMISQFPLDVMHMIYLGVSRRLFALLLKTKAGRFKLSDVDIKKLDHLCVYLSRFCPTDFARKPRPLSQYRLFKATEFRRLLLYDGFILHKNHKHKEVLECYMLLACAMRILLDVKIRNKFSSDAHALLLKFVERSYALLGPSFVVYNVHHLVHFVADCNLHGDPEGFRCFKYENHLGHLKNFLIAPGRTIQQIICRLIERSLLPVSSSNDFSDITNPFGSPHNNGPTLQLRGKQYASITLFGSVIRIVKNGTPKDSCVIASCGKMIVVENIILSGNITYFIGRYFERTQDYFQFPFPSSLISIFKVSRSSDLNSWNVKDISRKAVYYPLDINENDSFNWREDSGLCIPLLHSEACL